MEKKKMQSVIVDAIYTDIYRNIDALQKNMIEDPVSQAVFDHMKMLCQQDILPEYFKILYLLVIQDIFARMLNSIDGHKKETIKLFKTNDLNDVFWEGVKNTVKQIEDHVKPDKNLVDIDEIIKGIEEKLKNEG